MNFDFTDDQQAIKRTARDFLADRYRLERVRELAEQGAYDDGLWSELTELGWAGIFIDEQHGGQGLGIVELVILMEEMGYALAPSPFFSNAAAGLVIEHAGSDEQRARDLPGIAAGERRGALALADGESILASDAAGAAVVVLVDGESGTVAARGAGEDGDGSGGDDVADGAQHVDSIDSTRALYRFDSAPRGEPLGGDVRGGVDRARVALAAELVGVAQRALEMAVAYAREREQFGRPIGAYQAVSHRCAQMLLEVEGARSATYYAAWAADHEPQTLALAAAMAKAYASDAGRRVTASALQVHGGIGFTWEHDLHFFLKRANADAALLGTARQNRERVAELVLSTA